MRVLAIDPGYGRCGVAVVDKTASGDVLIYSDCIETSGKDEFTERLAAVSSECMRLAEKFEPDAVAIEKLFFSNNQKTAMRVAEVRGALISSATERDIPVFEYGPGQVKSATTGSGCADKEQIARMLHLLVKIDKKITHDDEYDAIAIGVTHLALQRMNSVSAKNALK
jgi:crossover junction endodeoxyribonuclease RuvC